MELTCSDVQKIFDEVKHLIPEGRHEDIEDFLSVGEPIMAMDFIKNAFIAHRIPIPRSHQDSIGTWVNVAFPEVVPGSALTK